MATDQSASRYQGILVHDERIRTDRLVSKTDSTTPSAYTMQSSRTGVAVVAEESALVLRTSGTQGQDGSLRLKTTRAGMPGSEGGGYVWRDLEAGDSTSQWYGWDGPQLITGWYGLSMTTTGLSSDDWPDIIRTDAGKLLSITSTGSTLKTVRTDTYDPTKSGGSEWTTVYLTQSGTVYTAAGGTVLQLPPSPGDTNGRVLLFLTSSDEQQIDMYKSDDVGATWSTAALKVLPAKLANNDMRQIRARYSGGQILLLVCWQDGSGNLQMSQYASDDLGVSFYEIVSDWKTPTAEVPSYPSIVELEAGGFLVCYHDGQTDSPKWRARRIGSAFQNLTSASNVEISDASDTATPGGCCWRDEDGTIYALAYSSASTRDVRPYRSTDEGETWEEFANPIFMSDSENRDRFIRYAANSIGGRTVMLTRWDNTTATTYEGLSVAAIYLGGFSRVTAPAHISTVDWFDTDYISWGKDTASKYGTALPAEVYLPINDPGAIGSSWNETGSGSDSLTSDGLLEVTSSSGAARYWYRDMETVSDADAFFGEFSIDIDSGDGDKTTDNIAYRLKFTDGKSGSTSSFHYSVSIQCDSTGYRVSDDSSTPATSDVAVDLTEHTHIRVAIDKDGKVSTWHAVASQNRQFESGVSNFGLTAITNAAEPSRITWGAITPPSGTDKARWGLVAVCTWAGYWTATSSDRIGKGSNNPEDLHRRCFSPRFGLITDNVKTAAIDGPALLDEEWQIDATADYPIEHLDIGKTPSPAVEWRSKDDGSNVALVWSLEPTATKAMLGSSTIGIWIQGANWRQGKLQGYNVGTASWDDIVALDSSSGWQGLPYARVGSSIKVDTGTAFKADHYFFHGAHEGDTFEDEGNGDLAKIQRNTEGAWTDETTVRPALWLDESAAASVPSSGTARIWRSSFGAVVHKYEDEYEILRLKIDAHSTADGDFRIGAIAIGPLYLFGTQYDSGWQVRREYNVETTTTNDGRRSSRALGPSRREVSIAWANVSLDLKGIQKASPVPDYVTGQDGGDPVASKNGTIRSVEGILEEISGSDRPVVFMQRITRPASGESSAIALEQPEAVVYGRVVTDPQRDNVTGDENLDEVERLNRIRISEEI